MNVFRFHLNESREGFCWKGREGGGHSMLMDRKQKRHGNQKWSLVWSIWRLRVIRSRAESPGGCVKLKTVTDMTEQCPWYSYSSVLQLSCTNSLLDWEPVEKLKPRGVMWSASRFFQWGEQNTSGCNEGRKQKARKEAWQNEWGDKFHCRLSGKILPLFQAKLIRWSW